MITKSFPHNQKANNLVEIVNANQSKKKDDFNIKA